jgi:Fe-S oxidoreductase
MKRPDHRAMRALPVLEARRDELEKCTFCPKLCRSACPVSNAEPRETVTPWGKMSMAYFAAHGDVPLEASYAAPAWACTGCMACRESCDHRNDVASTLFETRAALTKSGVAPAAAERVVNRFSTHADATRRAVRALCSHAAVRSDARDVLLIGCTYARGATAEAKHAIEAASALVRGPVALVEACCGLPLMHAGATDAFERQAQRFARETRRAEKLLVVDAGCAQTLRTHYARAGVKLEAPVELLVERAARSLDLLSPVPQNDGAAVRYHDPCQLGRGLGVYEAPRAVLARALGRPPEEFDACREKGACSGAGGLLPTTMPGVALGIADARIDEHERAGGGRIVTACASSLLAFRRRGRVPVDDLVTWIARAARPYRAVD